MDTKQVLSPAEWQSVSDYAVELSRRVVESSKTRENQANTPPPISGCHQSEKD